MRRLAANAVRHTMVGISPMTAGAPPTGPLSPGPLSQKGLPSWKGSTDAGSCASALADH